MVTAAGFSTTGGPNFRFPWQRCCCNVAPYQCHGLGDYFGVTLKSQSPQTALCFGNTVTPSAVRIHQLVKNGPLLQP